MLETYGNKTVMESYYGFIESLQGNDKNLKKILDAFLVIQSCRMGILPAVKRRLNEKDRQSIRSGSVFVFSEAESGIRRWTDGKIWSPSRILGYFLVYRQIERKPVTVVSQGESRYKSTWHQQPIMGDFEQVDGNGLIKKTLSLTVERSVYHLVSYYRKDDVTKGTLIAPTFHPLLRNIPIPGDFFAKNVSHRKPKEHSFDTYDSMRDYESVSSCDSGIDADVQLFQNFLTSLMTRSY